MSGNSSSQINGTEMKGAAIRAGTLILMQCFIIPGNLAILLAIWTFANRTVSDTLIGFLALVDLLNGFGPVNITIGMYYSHPDGFIDRPDLKWLCLLYNMMSCVLRLTGCFIATLMSVDRYVAIISPFRYRTIVTVQATVRTVLSLFAFSIVVGILSISGIVKLHVFGPICSFDFASPFAVFIVVLGYIQLTIVIACYVSVIIGIRSFLSRQTSLKATQLRASFASKSKQSSKRGNTIHETTQSVRLPKLSPHATGNSNTQQPRFIAVSSRPCELSAIGQERDYRNQSLFPSTSAGGSLTRIIMTTTVKRSESLTPKPTIKLNTEICDIYTDRKTNRDCDLIHELHQTEDENEARVQSSLRDFKKNHTTWKQSRKVAIVMGIVVFLFYLSWMPIVIIITMSLISRTSSHSLYFAAARMSLISSMLNVFVYGIMLKHYRQAYKNFFMKICRIKENPPKMQLRDCNAAVRLHKNGQYQSTNDRNAPKTGKRVTFKRAFNNTVYPENKK